MKTPWQRLYEYIKKYRLRLTLSLICAGLYGIVSAVPTYLVKHTIDDIFVHQYRHLIVPFMMLFLVFFVLKGIFMYLTSYHMHWVGNRIVADIRSDLFARVVKFPLSFFNKTQTGTLMSYFLHDTQMIQNAASVSIKNGVRSFFEALFLLSYAFVQSWKLTLIMLVIGPAIGITIKNLGKAVKKASRNIQHEFGTISSMLQEMFVGIREIKAFNAEQFESERFISQQNRCFFSMMRYVHTESLLPALVEVIAMLGGGIAFYVAINEVLEGSLTAGQLGSFIAAVLLAYQPLKRIMSVYSDVQYGLSAAEKLFGIMDTVYPSLQNQIAQVTHFNSDITFSNVCFAYDNKTVFQNLNLVIKKGECIGIIGPSGGGKSTLCDLLLRFINPQEGSILIDGKDYHTVKMKDLRSLIGYVSQRTFLFNDSVRANIAYATEFVSDDLVIGASKAAHAHEFVKNLTDGYLTAVGENGNALSGGQKQRITIARALLKDPEIIIFDEATSALDQEAERMICHTIKELKGTKTILLVSHRPSLLAYVDRLLVVEHYSISESPNAAYNIGYQADFSKLV